MRWGTRSLAGRVALASALAAALGGISAALSTGVTARELVSQQEQKSVRAEAKDLAKEVLEELEEDADEYRAALAGAAPVAPGVDPLLTLVLAHELEDVKLPSALAAIHDARGLLAGAPDLPRPERNECVLVTHRERPLRACTVAMRGRMLTLAASAGGERERSTLIVRALWVGLSLGALLGGLVGYFLSRWALSPLQQLRDRVRAMPSDDPHASRLGDVSPQLEVEELRSAIANLVERLGAALKQAQSFAAEAAHELRTPLTTIGGELELIAESGASDPAALARVRTQVAGLTELVQRLLVLAQPSRLPPESAELVDLSDVAEAALAAFAPDRGARVQTRLADDVIVRGDAALLRALLVNALDNALKFSSDDVDLSIGSADGQARIDVIDRGVGIAAAERERVFMPFYRAAAVRAGGTGGHGIGLSLIARVAWSHGGQAQLLEQAVGTHLSVRLPLWNSKRAPAA
jgi:signal transduction histidine kinase